MEKSARRLTVHKETLTCLQAPALRAIPGAGPTFDDTVFRPDPSDLCSRGCPIQA